jgi:hypothetical protein
MDAIIDALDLDAIHETITFLTMKYDGYDSLEDSGDDYDDYDYYDY